MILRAHQAQIHQLAQEIREGRDTREIVAAVTPGGGKSALPVILAHELIPDVCDRLLWVVPRSTLRTQGEREFLDPRWRTPHRLRATANGADPARGTQGYITTYQAIATDPGVHHREFQSHRYALFLDEPHHVQAGGLWERSLRPLVDNAALVVYASGTLERGDRQPIAFVDAALASGAPVIEYGRRVALADGAIAPVRVQLVDGEAEWRDTDGEIQRVDRLSDAQDEASSAVFTALRTDYARHLLFETVNHWQAHRRDVYPGAKLLVVAPDIEHASVYLDWIRRAGMLARIATSDDSPAALRAIDEYRVSDDMNVLVTVAMAYEGLSVPPITHNACLTHIRSKPWLEQCFARANRLAPGKLEGYVFAPADPSFRNAVQLIESETRQAARETRTRETRDEGEGGGERETVTPISSAAHDLSAWDVRDQVLHPDAYRDSGLTPREQETILRQQINSHVKQFVTSKRPGVRQFWQKKLWRRVREVSGGKRLADQSPEELVSVWAVLREEFSPGSRSG